jgi:hypothetical protein
MARKGKGGAVRVTETDDAFGSILALNESRRSR